MGHQRKAYFEKVHGSISRPHLETKGVRNPTYPYFKYPLFLGYDVNPLLKKEAFTMENRSVIPKTAHFFIFGVGG